MGHILVVDDEPALLRLLRTSLQARRYSVMTASTGQQALDAVGLRAPQAVLLDLGLPDLDGLDIIRGLRSSLEVPIIVLSGRTDPAEKIRALDAGADDYVTKPFIIEEVCARLRAVLRRPRMSAPTAVTRLGDHEIDTVANTVTGPLGTVRLTPIEWQILRLLLASPGRLVPGREILRAIWGPGRERHTNYLRVYFAGLRRKLEPDPAHPRYLITEPGIGYRYQP